MNLAAADGHPSEAMNMSSANHGAIRDTATVINHIGMGRGPVIHSRTTVRGRRRRP